MIFICQSSGCLDYYPLGMQEHMHVRAQPPLRVCACRNTAPHLCVHDTAPASACVPKPVHAFVRVCSFSVCVTLTRTFKSTVTPTHICTHDLYVCAHLPVFVYVYIFTLSLCICVHTLLCTCLLIFALTLEPVRDLRKSEAAQCPIYSFYIKNIFEECPSRAAGKTQTLKAEH